MVCDAWGKWGETCLLLELLVCEHPHASRVAPQILPRGRVRHLFLLLVARHLLRALLLLRLHHPLVPLLLDLVVTFGGAIGAG